MAIYNPFARHLYWRIWLTVVGGFAVLTLLVGLAWSTATEHNATVNTPQPRDMVLRDAQGNTIMQGQAVRVPGERTEGVELLLDLDNGQQYTLQLAPRPPMSNAERRNRMAREDPAAFWLRPPFGFLWMLAAVGLAVAAGVFPIIRRLTQRLEALQRSVKRFGDGDLTARVPDRGNDEMADLGRQFNAAAQRIQTLVQSHKSLLANASHELRSPLARIRMGMELMESGAPSPSFRQEILRNIAELDQLVDEILLASRLDAQEADVGTPEAMDLVGLVAEECARIGADLDVTRHLPEVHAIAKLLRRAVRNLLENARRYSQGDITVQLQSSATHACIRVCDQGPGVPVELRERIFEPFYRLPGASERAGGVGLGLALVRSIAQRHGGTVHCEDNQGGGACFVLCLPIPASTAAATHPVPHGPHHGPAAQPK